MENNPQKNLGGGDRRLGLKKLHFWVMVNLGLVFFVILLGYLFYRVLHGQKLKPEVPAIGILNQTKEVSDGLVPRIIDGIRVQSGQENLYPVAVMIDNSPEARPQAGIAKANYVVEAEAEGGITRYMAIFAGSDMPAKIGPVRSARPYFIDLANEFSAVYTHCGGSPDALLKITRDGVIDLNEFYNAKTFWRDNVRLAPHNIYSSKDLLNQVISTKGLNSGKYFGFNFKTDEDAQLRPEQSEIDVTYFLKDFHVSWIYKKDQNDYMRFVSGAEYKDEDGTTVRARNIIIQTVNAKVLDNKLRLEMNVIGEGKAVVCLDGKCNEGTWKKTSSTARTRFYDKNGQEFSFNTGTTWVEMVRPEISVKFD